MVIDVPGIIDGRYRIDRRASEGGFGTVYAGLHLALGMPVAVKVLRPAPGLDAAERQSRIERFLEEGRLLTRLRHPNIVSALDLGVIHEQSSGLPQPYLVMEWVEGQTLRQYLHERGRPLSVPEAWALFEPIADALAHAHRALVVHRDITPANVMLVRGSDRELVARVIDLGVAKAFAPDEIAGGGTTETAAPDPFTPAYAAPEQVTQARTGPWTDVHALGLLLVELLTGAPPYGSGGNPRAAAVDAHRPSPRARGVEVGPLETVIERALAIRPADCYENAGTLLEAARAALQAPVAPGAPPLGATDAAATITEAPASRTLVPAPRRTTSRRVLVFASIAAGAITAAGVWLVPQVYESFASSPAPTPDSSLSTLTDATFVKRIEAATGTKVGYHTATPPPSRSLAAQWQGPHAGSAYVYPLHVVDRSHKSHADARLDAMASWLRSMPDGTQYGGTDHAVAVLLAGGGADGAKLFDRVFAGLPMTVRGSRGAARDPVGAHLRVATNAPLTAKNLHSVSLDELSARLTRSGATPVNQMQLTADGGMIVFMRGGANGTLFMYDQGAKAQLPAMLHAGGTQAYATDGDAFVLVRGDGEFCTEPFLGSVLAGLGAKVQVQTQ